MREDRDLDVTAGFMSRRRFSHRRATTNSRPQAQRSITSESSYDCPNMQTQRASPQQPQSLTKSQLEALERQQEIADHSVLFGSSESGVSSSVSHHSDFPVLQGPQGLGIDLLEKPLPEIPKVPEDRGKQTTLLRFFHGKKHSYSDPNKSRVYEEPTASFQGGFSFRRGDEDLHSQRSERDRTKRKTVNEHLEHQSSPLKPMESPNNTPPNTTPPHEPVSSTAGMKRPTIKSKPSSTGMNTTTAVIRPSLLPRIQVDSDHPSRMNSSSSSVVTAVRHNSSRSSAGNSQIGRPTVNRSAGSRSSEAIAAATRAFAGGKPSPPITRKASEATSGGSGSKGDLLDGDGGSNTTAQRKPSIASRGSSMGGSDVGRKVVGGGRRKERT